jgi:hypothetical protein
MSGSGTGRDLELLGGLVAGSSPPFALGLLAFHSRDLQHIDREMHYFLAGAIIGLAIWIIGAFVLFQSVIRRFDQLTGRAIELPFSRRTDFRDDTPAPQ